MPLGMHGGIGVGNRFDPLADEIDWAARVFLAKVQQQRTWSNQGGDVRRVAVSKDARNVIREAVQHVLAMDRSVGRQTTIADETLRAAVWRNVEDALPRAMGSIP